MAAIPFPVPPVPMDPATPIGPDTGTPPQTNPLAGIQQQLMGKSDAERQEIANRIFADRGPAPPIPDFDTAEQAALSEMRQAGATQAQQPVDDGAGGWKKFIDTIADPTGVSNFLLNAGSNLLQPRSEAESSFGFGLRGINAATDRLTQARAARTAAEQSARESDANIRKTNQDIRESEAGLMTLPSEVALNNARAYQAWMAGNKDAAGPQAAAQVQMIDKLAGTLQRLAPTVFPNRDAATIQAFSLMNPDTTRQDFIGDYVQLNAFMYDDEGQALQAATNIADALGWSGNQTLGQILMAEQAAQNLQNNPQPTGPTQAEIQASQAGPDEAYAFLKKYYSDQYSDEQMIQFVTEAHGRPPSQTSPAPTTEPEAGGEPVMLREEPLSERELRRQNQREAQAEQRERAASEEAGESDTMMEQYRKLRGMSWEEAKAFYDTYKGRLNRRQKLALYRKLKAKRSGQSWIVPQTNPDA